MHWESGCSAKPGQGKRLGMSWANVMKQIEPGTESALGERPSAMTCFQMVRGQISLDRRSSKKLAAAVRLRPLLGTLVERREALFETG